jgi:hypothetical protein
MVCLLLPSEFETKGGTRFAITPTPLLCGHVHLLVKLSHLNNRAGPSQRRSGMLLPHLLANVKKRRLS